MLVTRVVVEKMLTDAGPLLCHTAVELDAECVVHNLNLISLPPDPPNHPDPRAFVSFPNHIARRPCPACPKMPRASDRYCFGCGCRLAPVPPPYQHHDDVHPICTDFRVKITTAVIAAYRAAAAVPADAPLPCRARAAGTAPAQSVADVEARHE